jgi:hypothetical protein
MTASGHVARLAGSMLVFAVVVGGCADPCLAVCEEARGCPDADPAVDCDTACAETDEASAGCEAELEALETCAASQVDVCEPVPELCSEQQAAYDACLAGE